MSSGDEVEKFEVTDYDLEHEFNINRPRKRQTKSQAIYGTFVDSDDDDWDSRPGLGGGRGKQNAASGISFVSGGIKKSAKEEEEEAEKKADGQAENTDDPLLQEQFGRRPTRQRKGYRHADKSSNQGFGEWERHTNKIASSIMKKLGYEPGQGLGKNKQGISTPVEAKLRLGKGAIGYYGTERTERSLKDFPVKDEEAEEEAKFKEQMNQWKRTDTGKKKTQYVYKTADELIAKGIKRKPKEKGQGPKVKVIDMTGKESRVLSGYHAIGNKRHDSDDEPDYEVQSSEKKSFDMPELLHNLNMLVDMTEEDIITRDRQLRYERDMVVNMQHEHDRLETLCNQEEQQINRLSRVIEMIDSFEERSQAFHPNPIRLNECAELFKTLQNDFYEEYKAYDLVTLSIAIVFPLVQRFFAGWQPLSDPAFGTDEMQTWKDLLDVDRRYGNNTSNQNAYSKLIWDVWMPFLRTTVSQWNSRSPDALIEVLEAWIPLLPPWTLQNILDQLINPKLQMEVDNWNPLTDTVPIHAWLHPWLPLMGSRLEPLWAPIRHKLATALNKWHPSDISAKLMLKPWETVFSAGHMEAFLAKNITPKLAMCLQEFIINPANQSLDGWNHVMAWQDMLSDQSIAGLIERHFFPRWLQTLRSWLNTNPNYEEVGRWYKGWKSMFPDRLQNHPAVKENFSRALNMMNQAVSNPGVPLPPPVITPVRPLIPGLYSSGASNISTSSPPPPPTVKKKPLQVENASVPLSQHLHSFKDLVAMKAEEASLQFYPIQGKTHQAKQIYQCGHVNITIDRGVIFIQDDRIWSPISLRELIERASD